MAVREIQLVALPAGPQKPRFAELVRKAVPESECALTDSPDDIVFYREQPHVPLAGLEQLGQEGYDAYRQMIGRDRFTPHSRIDIVEWLAISGQ